MRRAKFWLTSPISSWLRHKGSRGWLSVSAGASVREGTGGLLTRADRPIPADLLSCWREYLALRAGVPRLHGNRNAS